MDETPQLPTPGEAEGDRAASDQPVRTAPTGPADAEDTPTLPNPSQAEGEDA